MQAVLRQLKTLGALLACATVLAGCFSEGAPPQPSGRFYGIDVSRANYAQNWSMPDMHGDRLSLNDFAGKVVFVFFGFAQCPDVCPTTLLELAEVKRLLGPDGERLQIVFVTVDPKRDTPEVLRAYLASFDESAVGLVGSAEQLAKMARHFKVAYEKVPAGGDGSTYTINHSAAAYLYDPQGRLRLYERYGTPVAELLADIQQLLAGH